MRLNMLCCVLGLLGVMVGCGGDVSTSEPEPTFLSEAGDSAAGQDDENTSDSSDPTVRPDEPSEDVPPGATDEDVDDRPTEPDEPEIAAATEGCGAAVPDTSSNWSIRHDGIKREFLVHLPKNYKPDQPTPVVVNFHGRSMTAGQHVYFTGMNESADQNGFIVVYPEGTGSLEQTFNGGVCCGSAQASRVDDVGFTSAMLDELEAKLCVDSQRIYATGMSNGGFMAHRVACELSDRFAAISAVAGVLGMFDCQPDRPISVLHMHGTADSVVSYNGYAGFVGVPSTMDTWADLNGCEDRSSVYFQEDDVVCEEWAGCRGGSEVKLCTIEGGGHTWPGGSSIIGQFLGRTTQTISANDASWEFFQAHSL